MSEIDILRARINYLENLINLSRQDSEFDLFYQRITMTEHLTNYPIEKFLDFTSEDWYSDYWKLAGKSKESTRYTNQEKSIVKQIIELTKKETNSTRIQYLALSLILFNKMDLSKLLIDKEIWPKKLKEDFEIFERWSKLSTGTNPEILDFRKNMNSEETLQKKAILKNKYSHLIEKYAQFVVNEKTCPKVAAKDYKIFFCWFQGKDKLPPIVQCCYNSLIENTKDSDMEVCFIDGKNYSQYVDIPGHIIDKVNTGKISLTHFSDILRVNLLERHGGLWIDSTILVMEPLKNHKNFWSLPYYSQKFPGGSGGSAFLQGAGILHNPLYGFLKEFFNEYFLEFDKMIHYFTLDIMTGFAREGIPFVKKAMAGVPENNPDILVLASHLNDPYDEYPFDKILKDTFFHKLSYKAPLNFSGEYTVFRDIQKRYGNISN